jgi:hypothetical protein
MLADQLTEIDKTLLCHQLDVKTGPKQPRTQFAIIPNVMNYNGQESKTIA